MIGERWVLIQKFAPTQYVTVRMQAAQHSAEYYRLVSGWFPNLAACRSDPTQARGSHPRCRVWTVDASPTGKREERSGYRAPGLAQSCQQYMCLCMCQCQCQCQSLCLCPAPLLISTDKRRRDSRLSTPRSSLRLGARVQTNASGSCPASRPSESMRAGKPYVSRVHRAP